jgi:hypothetical protein
MVGGNGSSSDKKVTTMNEAPIDFSEFASAYSPGIIVKALRPLLGRVDSFPTEAMEAQSLISRVIWYVAAGTFDLDDAIFAIGSEAQVERIERKH